MSADLKTNAVTDSDVPARIVATATDLFGRLGTHACSMREILRKAGVMNEAAIRYYFGNKQGLLEACIGEVAAEMEAHSKEAWTDLEASGGASSAKDVVETMMAPFVATFIDNPQGVALVARLIREEGDFGQDLILEKFGFVIWAAERELVRLLPKKSQQAIRLHMFLAINNLVNGMVDQTLLWRLPAVEPNDQDQEARYHLSEEQLVTGFVEYLAAGVAAASEL